MREFLRRLCRIELGLELALMGVIVELFWRGIRPVLEVGCGSALTQFSDDSLLFSSTNHLTVFLPIAVMFLETNVSLRPWVKRAVRLGFGVTFALMLASYALSMSSFVR